MTVEVSFGLDSIPPEVRTVTGDAAREPGAARGREHATRDPLDRGSATGREKSGAWLRFVLGASFLASPRGRRLLSRRFEWLRPTGVWFERLHEFVPAERLREVYRAPLRVERQIVAADYEILAASILADLARRLEMDVPARGRRRTDLRVTFLSRTFDVEVKTHERRMRSGSILGGRREARALAAAAALQCSPDTPNLLVLGRLRRPAVAHLAREQEPGSPFGAIAWLHLCVRPAVRWEGALYAVPQARRPFHPAVLEILARHWEGR